MAATPNNLAAYIWSLADLLRGDFKQSQYGRVILPFTLLRRLECVLEDTKPKVLAQAEKLKTNKKLEPEAREKFLTKAAKQSFYNTSAMDMTKLGSTDKSQSPELRRIFLTRRQRDFRTFQILGICRTTV